MSEREVPTIKEGQTLSANEVSQYLNQVRQIIEGIRGKYARSVGDEIASQPPELAEEDDQILLQCFALIQDLSTQEAVQSTAFTRSDSGEESLFAQIQDLMAEIMIEKARFANSGMKLVDTSSRRRGPTPKPLQAGPRRGLLQRLHIKK